MRKTIIKPTELDAFPAVFELPTQWGDQDLYGHVNNTVAIRWFESSRVCYLHDAQLGEVMAENGWGIVVGTIHCSYRRPVKFPDVVVIGGRMAEMRHASLTLEHAIYSRQQKMIVADGYSKVVVFDLARERPIRVPDEIRLAAETLEGKPFVA